MTPWTSWKLACAIMAAGALSHAAPASSKDAVDSQRFVSQARAVADALFRRRAFRLAIDEYTKAQVLSEPYPDPSLLFDLGRAHYYAGNYREALGLTTGLVGDCQTSTSLCDNVRYLQVKALLRMEDFAHAAAALDDLEREGGLGLGLVHRVRLLKAFTALHEGRLDVAETQFATIAGERTATSPESVMAAEALKELRANPPQAYSPYVAGALSIVPGLGQAYTGHPRQGLSAFFISSALAGLVYDSGRKGREIPHYGDGATIAWGLLFALFYSGNIYNAVDLASASTAASLEATKGAVSAHGYIQILDE